MYTVHNTHCIIVLYTPLWLLCCVFGNNVARLVCQPQLHFTCLSQAQGRLRLICMDFYIYLFCFQKHCHSFMEPDCISRNLWGAVKEFWKSFQILKNKFKSGNLLNIFFKTDIIIRLILSRIHFKQCYAPQQWLKPQKKGSKLIAEHRFIEMFWAPKRTENF